MPPLQNRLARPFGPESPACREQRNAVTNEDKNATEPSGVIKQEKEREEKRCAGFVFSNKSSKQPRQQRTKNKTSALLSPCFLIAKAFGR